MHLLISFLVGIVIGLVMTIPLGPTSIYVAQKTMDHETRKGLFVSLGSVIIDILYCLVITLGLMSLVSPFLRNIWVQLGLSLFLILYGVKMLFFDRKAKPHSMGQLEKKVEQVKDTKDTLNVLLGTVMAISNPTLFLSWTAVLSFISAHGLVHDTVWDKVIFSFATGFGSFCWFAGLAVFVRSRRHTMSPKFVGMAGTIAAIVVIGFGVYFSISVFTQLNHPS